MDLNQLEETKKRNQEDLVELLNLHNVVVLGLDINIVHGVVLKLKQVLERKNDT